MLATAGGGAYVVGEAGLTTALHDAGCVLSGAGPDDVVLGETRTDSFEAITRAIPDRARRAGRASSRDDADRHPYRPSHAGSIDEIEL